MISKLDNEAPDDYHYGLALETSRIQSKGESAIRGSSVRGSSPMDSLGLRTDSMLDCLELIGTVATPAAANASESWPDSPPRCSGAIPTRRGTWKMMPSTTKRGLKARNSTTRRTISRTRILRTRRTRRSTKNSTTKSRISISTKRMTTSTMTRISTSSTKRKTRISRISDPTARQAHPSRPSRRRSDVGRAMMDDRARQAMRWIAGLASCCLSQELAEHHTKSSSTTGQPDGRTLTPCRV